tara:strand:+ start:1131 stop:1721 length:591 start_codon:yes stop_codon:yes gene_type:complete
MKKVFFVLIVFFISVNVINSQNKESKWVVGVSGSFVSFGDDGLNSLNERFNIQIPKLNVSRYIYPGVIADAGITFGALSKVDGFFGNAFDYFSLDGNIRYDFNLSEENLVPYVAIGGSIVGAPSTIQGSKATPTVNFTFGGTFWITHHWGLNAQATYKYSPEEYQSMRSHSQISAGLVYSLNPRVLVYRLWDGRKR